MGDLSKVYDKLEHSSFLPKLDAQRFSLKYGIESYLNEKVNRVNTNNNSNAWEGTCRPIFGFLLFNVSINDMLNFLQVLDMCNYVDDKTFYMLMREVSIKFRILKNENFKENWRKEIRELIIWHLHGMVFSSHKRKFVSFAN